MKTSSKVLWSAIGIIFIVALIIIAIQGYYNHVSDKFGMIYNANYFDKTTIVGNKDIENKSELVNNINVVNIRGNFSVNILPGTQSSIKITADQNILPYIVINLVNQQLLVTVKPDVAISPSQMPTISITTPVINALNITGNNTVQANNINTDQFEINTTGNNDITLSGKSTNINITSIGDSTLQSNNLIANNIIINGAGNADITVHPLKTLTVSILGNSAIKYLGNPTITRNSFGNVSVEKID